MNLRDISQLVINAPGVKHVRRARYERRFVRNIHEQLFRGVYETFAEARASAPNTRPLGYDNAESANLYGNLSEAITPYDYPVLYWLQKLIAGGRRRVFDLGGHAGELFYAFNRYLPFGEQFHWTVHDVPAAMEAGRVRAAAAHERRVDFSDSFDAVANAEVLLASGCLQYLPELLGTMLRGVDHVPAQVIINKTPVHPCRSFVTLNSIGTAFCPYRVFARDELVEDMRSIGFTLVDSWRNPGKACTIPDVPDLSIDHYSGFFFEQE